jgi:GTP pyrophosphokinase
MCCSPVPGDDIIGFITRGHGISIHSKNCVNYVSAVKRNAPEDMERWMEVRWTDNAQPVKLSTNIEVMAVDRVGLLFDVARVISESHVFIENLNSRHLKNGNAVVDASVQVDDVEQLNALMNKIRKQKGVISVDRARK